MHPITALMLAKQMEDERRRAAEQRRRHHVQPERGRPTERRATWIERLRLLRPGLSSF